MTLENEDWPMKVIQTRYAGCHFRSRLEARYAVFLDQLDIKWEYEPEGFDLFTGWYLPDFLLPDIGRRGSWLEIKRDSIPGMSNDDPRWTEMSVVTGKPVFVAHGLPRHGEDLEDNHRIEIIDAGWDTDYAFCYCHVCDKIGLQFAGRDERICAHGGDADHQSGNDQRILDAYDFARSARFERGDT